MNEEIKYQCPVCNALYTYDTNTCIICGWENDNRQNKNHNLDIGKNSISFNKYKRVFYLNSDKVLDAINDKNNLIKELYSQEPFKYDNISDNQLNQIVKSQYLEEENYPHKCYICGLGTIRGEFDICEYCTWENDPLQNFNKDFCGGANKMSFNQYNKFWEENKADILKNLKVDPFYSFKKKHEYEKKL